jgi:hypothetical protein
MIERLKALRDGKFSTGDEEMKENKSDEFERAWFDITMNCMPWALSSPEVRIHNERSRIA